jgi:hypothetical protein
VQSTDPGDTLFLDITATGVVLAPGDDSPARAQATTIGNQYMPSGFISVHGNSFVELDNTPTLNLVYDPLRLPDATVVSRPVAPMIAVLWDDFDPSPAGAGTVHFEERSGLTVNGVRGVTALVIQWRGVVEWGGANGATFELFIFDDTSRINARIVYSDTATGGSAAFGAGGCVGFQRSDTDGASYSFQTRFLRAGDVRADPDDVLDISYGAGYSRTPDGTDTGNASTDFALRRATPGVANPN